MSFQQHPQQTATTTTSNCYAIRCKVNNALYAIRTSDTNKPCVLAFSKFQNARQMMYYVKEKDLLPNKLVITEIPKSYIVQRCSLACLNIHFYEDNITYEHIDAPTQDIITALEDKLTYS